MLEKTIEKSFLYLLAVSVLLHLVAFKLVSLIPPENTKKAEVTTMVDLTYLPQPSPEVATKDKPKPEPVPKTQPPKPKREPPPPKPVVIPAPVLPAPPVARIVPKPLRELVPAPRTHVEPPPPREAKAAPRPESMAKKAETGGLNLEKGGTARIRRGEGLFTPTPQEGNKEGSKYGSLFPTAAKMKSLEDHYREKYRSMEQGNTRMMDTDDPIIGVFANRFRLAARERLNAIDRTGKFGAGVSVLRVTFKRDGTIENVTILDTTGNKALDALAVKATTTASYVGPLPKKWPHDTFSFIYWVIVEEGNSGSGYGTWE